MKWISVNKIAFILFLLPLSCQRQVAADLLTTRWETVSISRADTVFIPVEDGDYLEFNAEKKFQYSLKKVNMKKQGRWELKDKELLLHYEPENITRKFRIIFLSSNRLSFTENSVVFEYRKER
jgi:hypothetical protein